MMPTPYRKSAIRSRVFRCSMAVIAIVLIGFGIRHYLHYLARKAVVLPPREDSSFADGRIPATWSLDDLANMLPGTSSELAADQAAVVLPEADGIDVIRGEYIFLLADAAAADRMARLAREYGVSILDRYGNTIRVRAWDRRRLAALLRAFPDSVTVEANLRLRIPPLDESDAALPAPASGYRGFGDQALAWLGVPEPSADWGRGVVVAILDTGVEGVPVAQRLAFVEDGTRGGHGSLVAGIVAEMLPGASLLDVQVMRADGTGDAFTVARGIREAVDAGAQIINLSIGTRGDSRVLAEAVSYALDQGVLVVASAGNEGVERVSYPAAYEGVLSVAAVDADEQHLHVSNRGDRVGLAAPGVGVSVSLDGEAPVSFSGTSAAAPFVTATAGLALWIDASLGGEDVRGLLVELANDTGEPGVDALTGAGIVSPLRVQEKDAPGIVDMAVLRPYFHQNVEGFVDSITVAAQNRGTVDLDVVEMMVAVNEQEYNVVFEGVGRGRTIAYSMDAGKYLGTDGVLDVRVRVVVPQDTRPENNQIRSIWMPVQP